MLNENDARELAVHLKAIAGAISAIDIKVLRAVDEIRVAMQDIGIRATTIGEIMEQAAAECPDEPVSPAKAAAQHADEQYRGRASVLDEFNRSPRVQQALSDLVAAICDGRIKFEPPPPGHDEFKARATQMCRDMLDRRKPYQETNDGSQETKKVQREEVA